MKLQRHGDKVIVTGWTHERGTEKGNRLCIAAALPMGGIKKDGQWMCVASQLSSFNR